MPPHARAGVACYRRRLQLQLRELNRAFVYMQYVGYLRRDQMQRRMQASTAFNFWRLR